jgi:hypothetical protein
VIQPKFQLTTGATFMVVFIRPGPVCVSNDEMDDEIFPWHHPSDDDGIISGRQPSQFEYSEEPNDSDGLEKLFRLALLQFHEEEVVPIARYMAGEMNTNAVSPEVQKIRRLNAMADQPCPMDTWWQRLSAEACVQAQATASQAALIAWALLVRTHGRWDHKDIIKKRFTRNGEDQVHHLYIAPGGGGKEYDVYYDVWSNIHYGYVGLACGFSTSVLLNGAGLEQIRTDFIGALKGGSLPSRKGTQAGPQDFDDPRDSAAIRIGFDLYHSFPTHVTAEELLNRVVTNPLFAKPRKPADDL